MPKDFSKKPITTNQDLSAGALNYTTSVGRKFKLAEIILHASVAITETITITRDSKNGANYDHILRSFDLVGEQDFVFRPEGECNFEENDEIKVQCTNANLTGTIYVEIRTMEKS
ncbi:MAG: hypothetical protein PHY56_00890 [Candidatus Omnitrophica bacterium]|nr:hypothetical protein [Candidatus Omnitrophota bacterium]